MPVPPDPPGCPALGALPPGEVPCPLEPGEASPEAGDALPPEPEGAEGLDDVPPGDAPPAAALAGWGAEVGDASAGVGAEAGAGASVPAVGDAGVIALALAAVACAMASAVADWRGVVYDWSFTAWPSPSACAGAAFAAADAGEDSLASADSEARGDRAAGTDSWCETCPAAMPRAAAEAPRARARGVSSGVSFPTITAFEAAAAGAPAERVTVPELPKYRRVVAGADAEDGAEALTGADLMPVRLAEPGGGVTAVPRAAGFEDVEGTVVARAVCPSRGDTTTGSDRDDSGPRPGVAGAGPLGATLRT